MQELTPGARAALAALLGELVNPWLDNHVRAQTLTSRTGAGNHLSGTKPAHDAPTPP